MEKLGKIEKIDDLRTVWSHEAHDFSKWLSENLDTLGEAIGIDLVLEERESPVGSFKVDLYATEDNTGRKIIIENQLGDTDHDHLGKIITYASGKGAEVVIWIVKNAKDEHRQAIEWLNQHTDEKIAFFLLEIELWKIGESKPAPRFNVVERPNEWAKTMKAVEGLSKTKKLQLDFWQAFNEYAFSDAGFKTVFSQRKAQPQHWYDLSVGSSSYHIGLSVNTQKKLLGAELYINGGKANEGRDIFERFQEKKGKIESVLGMPLVWRVAEKDCRIIARRNGDITKGEAEWPELFSWLCQMALKWHDVVRDFGK